MSKIKITDINATGHDDKQVIKVEDGNLVYDQLDSSDIEGLDQQLDDKADDTDIDAINTALNGKQTTLVSGTNIKTINGNSILGSGDLDISAGSSQLADLTDVSLTTPTNTQVLKFNGSVWVNGSVAYSEVSGTPTLAAVASSGSYTDLSNKPTIPTDLNSLSDVVITTPAEDDIIRYDGANWVNVPFAGGGGANELNDLTDVIITSATSNDYLKYDGSDWVNSVIDYADIDNTPTLSDVALSGDYDDLTGTPVIGTDTQAWDADLDAIAAISGTSGLLKKTALNTWSLDTNTYLTTNQTITVDGDATGSGTTAITLTLANSGVAANTYKSVTVDAKGRVTAGTNPNTLAGYGITDAQPLDPDLTAIAALTGVSGLLRTNGSGSWSIDTTVNPSGSTSISTNTTITPTIGVIQYNVTALASSATFAAPSGTPTDGQKLMLRIKDDGTARSLTWTTSSGGYREIGVVLPTSTTATKILYIGMIYNSIDSFWDVVAVSVQA